MIFIDELEEDDFFNINKIWISKFEMVSCLFYINKIFYNILFWLMIKMFLS